MHAEYNVLYQYNLLLLVKKAIIIITLFLILFFSFAYFYYYTPTTKVYAYNEAGQATFFLPDSKTVNLAHKVIKVNERIIDFEILAILVSEKSDENWQFYQEITITTSIEETNFIEIIIEEEKTTLIKQLKKYIKEQI